MACAGRKKTLAPRGGCVLSTVQRVPHGRARDAQVLIRAGRFRFPPTLPSWKPRGPSSRWPCSATTMQASRLFWGGPARRICRGLLLARSELPSSGPAANIPARIGPADGSSPCSEIRETRSVGPASPAQSQSSTHGEDMRQVRECV
jgi:hypothetical protein